MKFSQLGQLALATAVSAALVLGITACGQSNTIDFIYVSSAGNNPGSIYAFASDGESGALTQIVGSPFPAGRNPVAMVTSPDKLYLYAINHDDNTIGEYAVGSDGKLYIVKTYNSGGVGTDATNVAIAPDGSALYVVFAYGVDAKGNPYSASNPGVGSLARFPRNGDGSLGTPVSYATCNNPIAVTVLGGATTGTNDPGGAVYVVDNPAGQLASLIDTVAAQNRGATGSATVTYPQTGACSGGANPVGQISGYKINANTDGSFASLTPVAGSPYQAGVSPVGITSDPTNRFVYAIDYQANFMLSYQVQSGGLLVPLAASSNTLTGQQPSAITVDPSGRFIYVSNYGSGTVSGFALNATNGVPSALAGSGSGATEAGPAAIIVEDSIGRYIYTANFVDGSVSGLYLDPNQGTTNQVQNTPFPGVQKATAVASVKHGDHAIQVNPSYTQ